MQVKARNLSKRSVVLFLLIILFPLSFGVKITNANAFEDTIEDVKFLLYGIAAGVAALILVIHGIKLKTASSPQEREEAKRGIIYVILGLVFIIIAASFVELIYKLPTKPPNPGIINAFSWATNSSLPWDNQTGFRFELRNNLNENLTNVEVKVSSIIFDWCGDDLSSYTFTKIPIILSGSIQTFSYDDLCEGSEKFFIQVKSDQNWWNFCADCPPSPGGDCNVRIGNC